jgi:hypothetical protein
MGLGNSPRDLVYSGVGVEGLDSGAISGTFCTHFLLFCSPFRSSSLLLRMNTNLWCETASCWGCMPPVAPLWFPPFCVSTICPAIYVPGIPHVEDRWPPVVSFGYVFSIFSFQFIANFNATDAIANICFAQTVSTRYQPSTSHSPRRLRLVQNVEWRLDW